MHFLFIVMRQRLIFFLWLVGFCAAHQRFGRACAQLHALIPRQAMACGLLRSLSTLWTRLCAVARAHPSAGDGLWASAQPINASDARVLQNFVEESCTLCLSLMFLSSFCFSAELLCFVTVSSALCNHVIA
jgi:hypothetical protein